MAMMSLPAPLAIKRLARNRQDVRLSGQSCEKSANSDHWPINRCISNSFPKKLAVHRVLYPSMLTESWVEGKSVKEKYAQSTERTAALWGLSSKIDSRIWVNFTRNGLRLGSRHQEPPHTDVSRNLATVVIRGVLPGLRRRRTGLLPSGSRSSSDESKFCISFGNQGPSADQLFKDADFIFQQDLEPAHTAKITKSWLNDHGVRVLDWPPNSPDLNPIENLWGIVKRKMRNKRPKKCRWAEGHCQRNHLSSATNWPPPCHAELRQ